MISILEERENVKYNHYFEVNDQEAVHKYTLDIKEGEICHNIKISKELRKKLFDKSLLLVKH